MSRGGLNSKFGTVSSARGRGGNRGRGGRSGRKPQLAYGGMDIEDGETLDALFPGQEPLEDQVSSIGNLDARYEDVRASDEIDSLLGFARHQQGPPRLGWLINMHATSVEDVERNSTKSAVDYYFLEPEGGSFKCTLLFSPYFYLVCAPGHETEVGDWLARKHERLVERFEVHEREDLDMANHLTGCKRRLVKLVFRNVQDLLAVRRELLPVVRRNEKRSDLVHTYAEERDGVRELEDCILEMREFDVPYYLRVAIDKNIRVGHWYDVCSEAGEISLTHRDDLVQ
ncbi:DNA polymerase epsilon catalytic subunit, partial [Coemansia sp. S85]